VLIAILAPTLTPVEALAVVVFNAPLKVPRPVTVTVFEKVAEPVTAIVPLVVIALDDRVVFTVELPMKIIEVLTAIFAPIPTELELIIELTVELPILRSIFVRFEVIIEFEI